MLRLLLAAHCAAAAAADGELAPVPLPDSWASRSAAGSLVWARLFPNGSTSLNQTCFDNHGRPTACPDVLPNYGNGYMAAQFPTDAGSAPCRRAVSGTAPGYMFIAGVFSGGLPPPFGEAMGAVSQRAAVPLPLPRVLTPGWTPAALANDFEFAMVEQLQTNGASTLLLRHYFHRASMHLIMADILLNNSAGGERVEVELATAWPSCCTWFKPASPRRLLGAKPECQVGTTAESERTLSGQGAPRVTIAVCYSPSNHTVSAEAGKVEQVTTIASVYTSLESADPLAAAAKEWQESQGSFGLQESHIVAQQELWDSRIEIAGDMELAKIVNSSLYGILISVRDELNYSTSPGGLPNGCYNGHTFWDVEQFIWPNLLLLHPKMARAAMQYRFDTMQAAQANAAVTCLRKCHANCGKPKPGFPPHCPGWPCNSTGPCTVSGLKYAWESAVTGYAATQACCTANEVSEIHIAGDVSLAMWQTFQASHDLNWLRETGWPVLLGIAEFWASRLTASADGAIALYDAGGPDETNSHANQSSYDLAAALHSLTHATSAAKLLGYEEHISGNWSGIIDSLPAAFAYDHGAPGGRKMLRCWADQPNTCNGIGVVMLRYPINISREIVSDAVHEADMDYYQSQWPDGNSMYWSMFTIGYADLGHAAETDHFFAKSSAQNVFGPFRIWSEAPGGGGCPNFLTGAGIYLQSVWAGYAGLRLADDSLHINAPRVPPGSSGVVIRKFEYDGSRMTLSVSESGSTLKLEEGSVAKLLVAIDGAAGTPMTEAGVKIPTGSRAAVFREAATPMWKSDDQPRPVDKSVYMDPSRSVEERVAALLPQMTLTEKQAQTINWAPGACCNPPQIKAEFKGIGLGAVSNGGSSNAAGLTAQNELQLWMMNNTRLGIPISFSVETLHSAVGGGAPDAAGNGGGSTIFPMPAMQGSTWNVPLVEDVARIIATEASAQGNDRGFSPEINGRLEENFGEDPALVSAMGAAAVRGLHGGNTDGPSSYLPEGTVVSEAKHAAAYGCGGKDGAGCDIGERTLYDVYLRPWRDYARSGGRGAMMAHNQINDVPCHASAELMRQLRDWGLERGFLASDFCDVGLLRKHPPWGGFCVAADLDDAAKMAMEAGLDMELCQPTDMRGLAFNHTASLVRSGRMDVKHLDRAVENLIRAKFAVGLFDRLPDPARLSVLNSPAHRAVARKVATEGAVLLLNRDGTLPLNVAKKNYRIAIVGPSAGCADNATSCPALAEQVGDYTGMSPTIVSLLAAAYNGSLPQHVEVTYHPGTHGWISNETGAFSAAVAAAKVADVVVAAVGDGDRTCGEDQDRVSIDLPGVQPELLDALAGTGTPVVAVLIHGRPVTFERLNLLNKLSAVVAAWRPGAQGGPALWSLLTGEDNFSGRLAQAWVWSTSWVHTQGNPWFHKRRADYDESPYQASRFAGEQVPYTPMFPFGFGLSYTSFNYTLESCEPAALVQPTRADNVTITVRVTNTGDAAGLATLGVYFRMDLSRFVRYHKMLAGFAKLRKPLAPGATASLPITFSAEALATWDPRAKDYVIEPQSYQLVVGEDSATERFVVPFVVS